ncbi:RagB/SusD family nutrient uptake outer membrane protein [Phocaeicola sp.]
MKKLIILILLTGMFVSCNDGFMDKYPLTAPTEDGAFSSYDNFKSYMYPCYGLFTNTAIYTNFNERADNSSGDFYAGIQTRKGLAQNPWAFGTITNSSSSGAWAFGTIRRINIMLSHLDDGNLTAAEKEHWKSVGYFFHSWWYMEMLHRFGDLPWVNETLNEYSEAAYGPRIDRKIVADSILNRLKYAEAHIGSSDKDGDCAVNRDCVRAALSRFTLREGTWRKYHKLGDHDKYLQECVRVSELLMADYPSLYNGTDRSPGTGYGELWTTEDLKNVSGVIFYKQYVANIAMHRASDYQHISAHSIDVPQHVIDLFLCSNGKPILNSASNYAGDKDMYDTFDGRDPRLYQNIMPPYQVKAGKGDFPTWSYEDDAKYRKYIDLIGANETCAQIGGIGMKRIPAQNWGATLLKCCPNMAEQNSQGFIQSRTGYYFWKHYNNWGTNTGNSNCNTADMPIFKIEEVLLNYAEAKWELGAFDQNIANQTINKLRERVGVTPMAVGEIGADWDPARDKGGAVGYDDYEVDPVLWEIRRERLIELFGEGFAFYDVKRWKKAHFFLNKQPYGMWIKKENQYSNNNGKFNGKFIDLATGNPDATATEGYIYTYAKPTGWKDMYYLEQVPTSERILNPALSQNPGYEEEFGK